jgi:hypothetical protein
MITNAAASIQWVNFAREEQPDPVYWHGIAM